jgi:benzoate-CoA ligase family protein
MSANIAVPKDNALFRFILDPAEADPDRVALIDAPTDATTTRAQLAHGIGKAAGALHALGIQPEQRVMMVMADRPAFLEVFWGAMTIGAVPVPVSTMLGPRDYTFLLRDSRARAIVLSDLFAANVLPATKDQPFLTHVLVEGKPSENTVSYAAVRDAAVAASLFPSDAEDVAFWLYTSGTTGFPKGAIHRHGDMAFLADRFARDIMRVDQNDRMYAVPKLFFAYGLGVNYFALGNGASQILFDGRPTVDAVLEHVRTHKPTLFWGVPTFLSLLLGSDAPNDSFAGVRAAVTGGETLPDDLRRRCKDRFDLLALDAIGSTEAAHIYICNRLDRQHPGSTGWVVDGFEVELRDASGALVLDGEPGELYLAGDSITTGYWRRTERNRKAFQGRFFATGDTFVRNDDGSYTYLGRGDDMIKASGLWVSPAEVEAAIVELPEVSLAAVVAAQAEDGLDKPKAFVVLERGLSGGDELTAKIQEHVKKRLAPYKYPRWVEYVTELPLTPTGKVKRYLLREPAKQAE